MDIDVSICNSDLPKLIHRFLEMFLSE